MTTIAANGTESNIQNSLQLCYVPNLTMSSFAYYTIQLRSSMLYNQQVVM